jgi:hypothetical protein
MMLGRLGEATCDPYWTETNAGMCSDSAGNLLAASGAPAAIEVLHAADNPNYSMTVSANSPSSSGFLNIDPKTLAFVVGGVLVFWLFKKK